MNSLTMEPCLYFMHRKVSNKKKKKCFFGATTTAMAKIHSQISP